MSYKKNVPSIVYNINNLQKGIEYLGITNCDDIFCIIESNWENLRQMYEDEVFEKERKRWMNRHTVPQGLNKKQLNALLKDTQAYIDHLFQKIRLVGSIDGVYLEEEKENFIIKKAKIKKILRYHKSFGKETIQKAKEYPIENLLTFNTMGFVSCPFHGPEKTPSAKWYPKRNKIHCFGCGVDADSLDIYMKLHSVDLNRAIKALS